MAANRSGIIKVCPKCNGKMQCIDSRVSAEADKAIRRRYRCCECNHRYSTIEIPIDDYRELLQSHIKLNCLKEIING